MGPLGSWRGAVAGVGMTVLGVVLCATPLFNLLGYEAAAASALGLTLLAPLVWLHDPHLGLWGPPRDLDAMRPTRIWGRFVWVGALLTTPTLLLLMLNGLRVPNCALTEGIWFFGLIVGGALALSALWALFAVTMAGRAWTRWAVYLGIFFSSVVALGVTLALEPPVRVFHPVIGLFAGSIYDEALNVPPRLVLYRAWNVVFVVGALAWLEVAWSRRREHARVTPWVLVAVALTLVWLGVWRQRAPLGLEVSRADIEAHELNETFETEHFIIHYTPGSWQARHIEALAQDHEFRYAQLVEAFGGAPSPPRGHIHSYLYASADQKGRLLGMRRTMLARLWLGEIHLQLREVGQPLLMHELVHIFSADYGVGPLRLSSNSLYMPNMGLIEGLAEAVTWQSGELTPHGWSAAMRRLKVAPDVRRLVRADGFYSASSARAYTLVGSFCRFLIDKYGMEKFLRAYGDGDLEGVYGQSLTRLVAQWEEFVDATPLSDEELALAEFFLDRPSIFEKRCARTVAELRLQGSRLKGKRRMAESIGCYEAAVALSPKTPQVRLELVEALLEAEQLETAQAHLQVVMGQERLSRSHRAWALERVGDIHARRGEGAQALESYQASMAQHPRVGRRRSLEVKMASLGDEVVADWFFGRAPREARLLRLAARVQRSPRDAVARYLLARQQASLGECEEARRHLTAALTSRRLPGPALKAEARRLRGRCAWQDGRFAEARADFEALSAEGFSQGLRAEARDWLRRVDWTETRR